VTETETETNIFWSQEFKLSEYKRSQNLIDLAKVEKRKIKKDMLRSPGESVESVLKKKMKATVGRICRNGRF